MAAMLLASSSLFGAEPLSSLSADAGTLIGGKATVWKSPVLEMRLKDGSTNRSILVLEFSPFTGAARASAPQASAKLSVASPAVGIPGVATVSGSVGDGSKRDVRLEEKDGVRTMTFVRALETVSKPKPKTERLLRQVWSSSFSYELQKDALVLKGFSDTGTVWGVSEFIAPQREIRFKPGQE